MRCFQLQFDVQQFKSLGRLSKLTDLTLIDIELVHRLAQASSLNSVTSLTVCRHRSGCLLKNFFLLDREQGDNPTGAGQWPRHSFAVELFNRALSGQFPKLENLTLVGNLENHQLVCEQLRQTLGKRLQLALFIEELEDNPQPDRAAARQRQTARKSVRGRAPMIRVGM